ncbi:MAG: hypothetical protein K2X82_19580 [Gemmataceae bacterium]|nr:hypothetical protein [Gemmataceae bacterium]
MCDGYDPAGLPAADAVEVVPLDPQTETAGPAARLTGGDAARVADLWRRLPPGEERRCHDPAFTLRFLAGGRVLAEGSVCWECHNIHVTRGDGHATYEFDADSPTALQLLDECRRVAGG